MSYKALTAQAKGLFQSGEFEQSLRLYQDLWQTSTVYTFAERFELLNALTNCQINLGQFAAAYEHLDELNQLATVLQTAEALYYTALKRALIIAADHPEENYDRIFDEVFVYAQQTFYAPHQLNDKVCKVLKNGISFCEQYAVDYSERASI